MTRKSPQSVPILQHVPLSPTLHDMCIDLYIDIFFVSKMAFLFAKSGRVNFVSVKALKSKSFTHLLPELRSVIDLYGKRGMTVINVHGDGEFDSDRVRDMIVQQIFIFALQKSMWG